MDEHPGSLEYEQWLTGQEAARVTKRLAEVEVDDSLPCLGHIEVYEKWPRWKLLLLSIPLPVQETQEPVEQRVAVAKPPPYQPPIRKKQQKQREAKATKRRNPTRDKVQVKKPLGGLFAKIEEEGQT